MRIITLMLMLVVLSPFSTSQVSAEELQAGLNEVSLLLPVNITSTPRLNMLVVVPKGYKSLQSLKNFSFLRSTSIEFILENEDANNWNEIITVSKYIESKINASQFTKAVKDNIFAVAKGKVISESHLDKGSYKQSKIILEYRHQNRTEVIGMLYNSGPYDCVGVQYTIRPKGKQSAAAIEKIENFFKDKTDIVTF